MATKDARLLLLIEDDPAQGRLLSAHAVREGWRCQMVETCEDALALLNGGEGPAVESVVLARELPGDESCTFIAAVSALRPGLPILMLTASASPMLAIQAMRAGASDYLIRPVSADRLVQALRTASMSLDGGNGLQPLSEKLAAELDFDAMVGTAPPFRTALAKAATAARGHGHVLVEGETGTGKDMLLRAMHATSARAKTPMRYVHCAGLPAASLGSLLFGHEKGAIPGAFDREVGLFQHCDTGTLILDDIDRIELEHQERLAEVLESGIVRPIGATHGFRIDVRVLASTDHPIDELVAGGLFCAKLRDALTATRIHLPPLRAPTRHFLARIGRQPGLAQHSIADSALTLLEAYEWPGNVRQLEAVLFRAAVFCEGEALTADDFPQLHALVGDHPDRADKRARGLGVLLYTDDGHLRSLEEIEADIIRLAIGHYRGRMTEVARRLGIGRSTLYRKLAELGIDNAA